MCMKGPFGCSRSPHTRCTFLLVQCVPGVFFRSRPDVNLFMTRAPSPSEGINRAVALLLFRPHCVCLSQRRQTEHLVLKKRLDGCLSLGLISFSPSGLASVST